ncbi:MAG: hypothetical protein ACYTEW_20995 [Planctomycetota bacterium]
MTDCLWNDDGPPWECKWCSQGYTQRGELILSERPPRRNCPKAPNLRPATEKLGISWEDVPHYAQALARWTAAGFPVRSQAEVGRIYEEFCTPCTYLVGGRCRKCGCGVNQSRVAVLNKIKMATEDCPEGKWNNDA